MTRTLRPLLLLAAMGLSACGTQAVSLPGERDAAIQNGARIFDERCSGCHTLSYAGAQGSAVNVNRREYKDGPNFNVRAEEYDQILYAIRNGGYSSGPMPQNIAVGTEAEDVAKFLAKYSGRKASRTISPGQEPPAGQGGPGSGEAPPAASATPSP